MAYASDKKPGELTALTSLATDDVFVVGDTSDVSEVAKGITKANLEADLVPAVATTVTTNANLTGHVTSSGNAAVLGSFTKAQLDTAVSDDTILYDSELTSIADVKALNQSLVSGAAPVLDATNFTNLPSGTVDVVSNVATASILGRATAGSGDSEELTATQARTLLNVEDGADVTDATNVTAAGALMDSELTSITDVKALDQSVVSGASPTFATTNMTEGTNKNFVSDAEATVIGNTSGTNTGDEAAASETVAGVVELATDAEMTTGTDTSRAITPANAKVELDKKLALAGGTMTGDITLGETDIKLDATLSADEKWSGIVVPGTAGATLAVGDVCYLASTGKWLLNDGILDGTDTGFSKQLGICVDASTDTNPTEMLVYGKVRSAAFPAFTVGSPVYLSDTAGDLVVAQPTTTNFAIRVVGFALSAEELMFQPSQDYIVHV